MTPAQAHRGVLAQLALLETKARGGQRQEARAHGGRQPAATLVALAVLAGRRRILQRHAPEVYNGETLPFCEHHGQSRTTAWPCDDYRDAAADLMPGGETRTA